MMNPSRRSLTQVFQISIYTLTAFAAGMLAYGEEFPIPTALTIPLAVLAYHANDRHRKFHLNTFASNLLATMAVTAAAIEFFSGSIESRLLSGAHLMAYITWIVMFQHKSTRQYWWLCALGLLQVAVGSVLTNSGWYGIMLLVYLMLGLWTLSVLALYQAASDFGATDAGLPELPARTDASGQAKPATRGDAGSGVNGEIFLTGVAGFRDDRSQFRNAVQQDVVGQWISARFVWGGIFQSLAGIAFGFFLFLLVPRLWIGSGNPFANSQSKSSARLISGFSTEVQLGNMGRILESTNRVMQVKTYRKIDPARKIEEELDLYDFARETGYDEPLFRGSVLAQYQSGKWTSAEGGRHDNLDSGARNTAGAIRQEYILDQSVNGVLFAMRPIHNGFLVPYDLIAFDRYTQALSSGHGDPRGEVEYYIYSLPQTGPQTPSSMQRRLPQMPHLERMPGRLRETLVAVPPELDRLQALAAAVVQEDSEKRGDSEPSPRRKADALVAHLRDSGLYSYSLDMSVIDSSADPIEDFLFNRKSGHCEYFATALALLLRSEGIPSRLVTGFKGAERNTLTDWYEVQQRHAHAWVEAFIDDNWTVVDATPAERDDQVRSMADGGFWQTARDRLHSIWMNYVVGMSIGRQQNALYEPVQGSLAGIWQAFSKTTAGTLDSVKQTFSRVNSGVRAMDGKTIASLLGIVAAMVVLVYVARHKLARARKLKGVPGARKGFLGKLIERLAGAQPAAQSVIRFYEQFLLLVASRGQHPRSDQTQREFASQVALVLEPTLVAHGLVRFPSDITEVFYRVRFGGSDLSPQELGDLETSLARFNESLHKPWPAVRHAP
jgi:protein-glutamine gamma-glutamyltransferase